MPALASTRRAKLVENFRFAVTNHRAEDGDPAGFLALRRGDLKLDPDQLIPFATTGGGDALTLAPQLLSDAGHIPVVRFVHDECLTCEIEAASLGEWLGRQAIEVWAHREGLTTLVAERLSRPISVTLRS